MEISINEFLADPLATKDDCFNFYDWFCRDESLKNRMLSLKGKVSFLVKSGLIDGNTHYVWFKNNCPAYGDLYDDIRISRIEDDGYICGLAPKLGYDDSHLKGKCSFWSFSASGDLVEKIFSNYREFKTAVRNGEVRVEGGVI